MIFTSFEFVVFFALVVLIRSCLRSLTAAKWFLLAASICFYLSWSVPCVSSNPLYIDLGLLDRAEIRPDYRFHISQAVSRAEPGD